MNAPQRPITPAPASPAVHQQPAPEAGAMTKPAPAPVQARNVPQQFRQTAARIAGDLLTTWVGEERAKEAIGRITAALSASAAAARDPQDFYLCTPQSIATCVAVAALTGIMPGTGSAALAYVVPQRPRKGEPPQLQYSLSHRGLNALARRCGQTMIAVPVGNNDEVEIDEFGQVRLKAIDIDDPPTTWDDLRGVAVLIRDLRSNNVVHRGWVPKKLIAARRAMSRSAASEYSPWVKWPVEMALKTAMHYAISRGWCVVDDTEAARALSADTEMDLEVLPSPASPPAIGRTSLRNGKAELENSPEPAPQPEPEPRPEDPDLKDLIESLSERIGHADRAPEWDRIEAEIQHRAEHLGGGATQALLNQLKRRKDEVAARQPKPKAASAAEMF